MKSLHCFAAIPRTIAVLGTALALTVIGTDMAAAAICRVTPTGNTGNDGSSWAAPMDMQGALADANCNEIWVAKGVYTPVVPANAGSVTDAERGISFTIARELAIYGGFAGSEQNRGERDPRVNPTILSGDLTGDDDGHDADGNHVDETWTDIVGSNSNHVVYFNAGNAPLTTSTVLDGLIVTGGNMDAGTGDGGGLYCYGGINECSPVISNITVVGNHAQRYGGGMYNNGFGGISSPTLFNVTFSANHANAGGGMYNQGYVGVSSPSIRNATFSGNDANSGGAIYSNGNVGESSPVLTNVTLVDNSADYGAALYGYDPSSTSTTFLVNVIVWGNGNSSIYEYGAKALIDHSVITYGCPTTSDTCTAISALDPLLGPLGNHGGVTATQVPGVGGSAIDAGLCPGDVSGVDVPATDQRGVARPQYGACDIGAVEFAPVDDTIFADDFDSTLP